MALRYKRARIAESISLLGVMLCIFQVHYANAQGAPPGFVIENAFPTASFSRPVQIVFLPDGRKLVVEQGGRVWTMTSTGSQMGTPFIDLSTKVLSNTDRGLLGVALDPDFSTNRWVYFLYVVDPDSDDDDNNQSAFSRLERYKADSLNPNVADL
jgi:glucose/arabinose dehydrogenase